MKEKLLSLLYLCHRGGGMRGNMIYFEKVYAKFLSANLLLNNVNIHGSYVNFLKEYYPVAYKGFVESQDILKVYEPKKYDEIEYNQEIIDNMVSLMDYTRNNYTTLNKKDVFFDLLKSDRDIMFHYIWDILNIKQLNNINHEKDDLLDYLSQYQLHDGVLKKIEYKNNICNLYISNVLHYNHDNITSKNIIMKFEHVDNVAIKGSLYLNALSHSVILDITSHKISNGCYCHDILCIVQNEPLIILIICKNIKVIEMNNESLTLFNN